MIDGEAVPPPVRLSDVAKRTGYSAATVSRVLNRPETVNAEARSRVEAAVRELGYMRNGAARALRSRRTGIVGLILPTVRQPLFADLVDALQDRLAQHGQALLIATVGYSPDLEVRQALMLAERGVDGLVLVGRSHPDALYHLLDARRMASVFVLSGPGEPGRPTVGLDDEAAMERIVDHLCGLGHRDIALLSGMMAESDRTRARVSGAEAALRRRGLPLPRERRAEEQPDLLGGRMGLQALLAPPRRPTAVICTSDLLAMGALFECAAQGIAVPDDMSITGYDDIQAAAQVVPALTTVALPVAEIGRRAADCLSALLEGRPCPDHVRLETRLVTRASTSPPRGEEAAPVRHLRGARTRR